MSRQDDFEWFLKHRDELVREHNGQSVVIRDGRILGFYDDDFTAFNAMKGQSPESYIIQQCLPPDQTDLFYLTGAYSFK